ncbi:MAG: hypothetical protein JJE35_12675 [Thermoleophilia bacterium]|nr:hypothetical protein [Thermoleophilia bacterium]
MDRKLSVGETFSEVFAIYRSHAGVLLPVAFWLFLVVAIFDGLARDNLTLLTLSLFVSIVVGTLYKGIVVSLVRDVQDGRRDSSVGELINWATPVLAPLLGAGILSALGITLGIVLLIVPGLFLLTIWAVIAPVIVIERCGVFDAFRRSRDLVRGNGWPVFGAVLIAYVIIVVGSLIFGGIAAGIADGPLLRIVFSALASTVTAPIDALVAAVLYYRLLAIKGPAPAPIDPTAPVAPPA